MSGFTGRTPAARARQLAGLLRGRVVKPAERKAFERMWRRGVSIKDMAAQFNISPGAVISRRLEWGLKPRGNKRPIDPTEEQVAKRMRAAGMRWAAIATAMNRSVDTVRRFVEPERVQAWRAKGLERRTLSPNPEVVLRRCAVCGGKEKVDEPHQHAA